MSGFIDLCKYDVFENVLAYLEKEDFGALRQVCKDLRGLSWSHLRRLSVSAETAEADMAFLLRRFKCERITTVYLGGYVPRLRPLIVQYMQNAKSMTCQNAKWFPCLRTFPHELSADESASPCFLLLDEATHITKLTLRVYGPDSKPSIWLNGMA